MITVYCESLNESYLTNSSAVVRLGGRLPGISRGPSGRQPIRGLGASSASLNPPLLTNQFADDPDLFWSGWPQLVCRRICALFR
jgi:hypothetical protein